jgi:hypothetical protein
MGRQPGLAVVGARIRFDEFGIDDPDRRNGENIFETLNFTVLASTATTLPGFSTPAKRLAGR